MDECLALLGTATSPPPESSEGTEDPGPGPSTGSRKRQRKDPPLSFSYYAGFDGHAFIADVPNIFDFDNLKNGIMEKLKDFSGIYSPMLFIGGKGSIFSLHLEDFSLGSLNYNHGGGEKIWYT